VTGCLLLALSCHAKQIEIINILIPGLHSADLSGKYDLYLKRKMRKSSFNDYKIEVLRARYAFHRFEKCTNCCISPVNFNQSFYDFNKEEYYTTKKPLGIAKIYIWTLAERGPISRLSDLYGQRIGARKGMPLGTKIYRAGLDLELVSFISQNIQKLLNKDIDAFIDYTPDVLSALSEEKAQEKIVYAENFPLEVHSDNYVCKKSDQTHAFLKALDK